MTARRITCDGPSCDTWVADFPLPDDWLTVVTLHEARYFCNGWCLLEWTAAWAESPVLDPFHLEET